MRHALARAKVPTGWGMNADTGPWHDQADDIARFFDGDTTGRALFEVVANVIAALGPSQIRVGRSQAREAATTARGR